MLENSSLTVIVALHLLSVLCSSAGRHYKLACRYKEGKSNVIVICMVSEASNSVTRLSFTGRLQRLPKHFITPSIGTLGKLTVIALKLKVSFELRIRHHLPWASRSRTKAWVSKVTFLCSRGVISTLLTSYEFLMSVAAKPGSDNMCFKLNLVGLSCNTCILI